MKSPKRNTHGRAEAIPFWSGLDTLGGAINVLHHNGGKTSLHVPENVAVEEPGALWNIASARYIDTGFTEKRLKPTGIVRLESNSRSRRTNSNDLRADATLLHQYDNHFTQGGGKDTLTSRRMALADKSASELFDLTTQKLF